ncbi:hypothetical protein Leryth_014948 [Lithospermum erythrorhizon]|nr:hypothetical protein Leryth_014948 [Lithospermum erythrorhizon]
MTPNYLNPSQNSTFFVGSSNIEDDDDLQFHQQFFSPSFQHQHDASSSSHSFQFYFNNIQDQAGYNYHHTELVNKPQQPIGQGNESAVVFGGSFDSYQVETKVEKRLKVSLVSKEGKHDIVGDQEANNNYGNNNSAKFMSSKVRMMHKMKKSDPKKGGGEKKDTPKLSFNNNNDNFLGSNDHESNCSSYNNSNTTIRVCVDCNTTKTPLWRSGPKGPKSLCNACGIRQRKARRALAAAAAATTNGTPLSSIETPTIITTTKLKIKVNHQKEKSKNNYGNDISGLSTVPFKKRCRVTNTTNTNNASLAIGSSSSDQEPEPVNRFEGFLINLRNKLISTHSFPKFQMKKEAIL